MNDKIKELKKCYQELFDREIGYHSYIEISDREDIILSANKEGLLVIIGQLISLCGKDLIGSHYHLDEAGMANICEKPMIFQLVNPPLKND